MTSGNLIKFGYKYQQNTLITGTENIHSLVLSFFSHKYLLSAQQFVAILIITVIFRQMCDTPKIKCHHIVDVDWFNTVNQIQLIASE